MVEPHLYGQLCGMCGNFDRRPENDMMNQYGAIINNVPDLGATWAADRIIEIVGIIKPLSYNIAF